MVISSSIFKNYVPDSHLKARWYNTLCSNFLYFIILPIVSVAVVWELCKAIHGYFRVEVAAGVGAVSC